MTSVGASPVNATWEVVTARWCASVILLLLLFTGFAAVVDGHRSHYSRPPSSVGDRPSIHDSKVVQDTDHINEHLQELKDAVNVSAMSPEELEFHYFKMHDFDNNTKLDGLEILKALTHLLPYEEDEQDKANMRGKSADEKAKEMREKELLYYTEIVDTVLSDDDIDDDGYLTYPEYIIARRRAEARIRAENTRRRAEAQEEMETTSSSSSSGHSHSSDSRHH